MTQPHHSMRPLPPDPSGPKPPRRRPLFAALTACLAVISVLALSEAASRILRVFVCEGRGTPFYERSAEYGWGHQPGARGVNQGCIGRRFEYRVPVEVNARGLLGAGDVAYAKSPGTTRVVVLGDSVVEAAQVERGLGFVERTAAELASSRPGLEILNAGVAGFSTHNQLLYYRAEAAKYSPDLVVSAFNIQNDPGEISPPLHRRDYIGMDSFPTAPMFVDTRGNLVVDTSAYRVAAEEADAGQQRAGVVDGWLTRNLYLYRRAKRFFEPPPPLPAADPRLMPTTIGVYVTPEPPEWREAWSFVEAGYRTLAGDVAARGGKLVVLVLPSREMVLDEDWRGFMTLAPLAVAPPARIDREAPRRHIAAILTRLGIPFLDVTDSMRAATARTGRRGYYRFDLHPDADGHQWLSEAFAPWLASRLDAPR